MPSKALLHAAGIHAKGGGYSWRHASNFRDWITSREKRDWPDDSGHVKRAREGRRRGRSRARRRSPVRAQSRDDAPRAAARARSAARNLIVAVGTAPPCRICPGSTRSSRGRIARRPAAQPAATASVMGGGPTGVELAQAFARYGVPVTIVHPDAPEPPRPSAQLGGARQGLRATASSSDSASVPRASSPRAGKDGAHEMMLSDGTTASGHEVMLSIGRTLPLDGLGLEAIGVEIVKGRVEARRAPAHRREHVRRWRSGRSRDAHPPRALPGRDGGRIALGDEVTPDYRAIPRCVYTDPETGGVGLLLDQAKEQGIDAFELTVDLAETPRATAVESFGHVTIVVDRRRASCWACSSPARARQRRSTRRCWRSRRGTDRGAGGHDPRIPDDVARDGRPVQRGGAPAGAERLT